MVRDKVGKGHYVAGREGLDDAFVLGREYAAVLERLHEVVDVVNLVDLGAGEVKDDGGLAVIIASPRNQSTESLHHGISPS